jgi:hypothetical protein
MTKQTVVLMPPTTIRVKTETRDRLNNAGLRNESYDDIINRLLDATQVKEVKKKPVRK